MPGLELSDEALTAALRAYPELRERVSSILPSGTENRRPQRVIISRLTQGFSIRCLRFKSGVAAAPARLASG